MKKMKKGRKRLELAYLARGPACRGRCPTACARVGSLGLSAQVVVAKPEFDVQSLPECVAFLAGTAVLGSAAGALCAEAIEGQAQGGHAEPAPLFHFPGMQQVEEHGAQRAA